MSSRPELKVEDETSFIRYFKSLPEVSSETVKVFDRGDWYTAHGEDANFIARTVRLSEAAIQSSKVTRR